VHPPDASYDLQNANNNSGVLQLESGSVRMVLTGDCQAENWTRHKDNSWPIALPTANLKLVQIPHHGARSGLFDRAGGTPL
jgi:beta-lactamase superfamily II metal-dependent hydrolase